MVGAAGYVSPRHLKAIQDTGNQLISVYDPSESLGILDQYFPEAACFSNFESYAEYHNQKNNLDYLSICSPNHHHFSQICWGLENGANIICEKPMVIHPEQLERLKILEQQSGKKVNTILQLRLLPNVSLLKKEISTREIGKKANVSINYVTARGNWYFNSWKGREEQSGGIVTNIGIHLFDLLIWLFGTVEEVKVNDYSRKKISGFLSLERANVEWSLSIDEGDLPLECIEKNTRYYRELLIDDQSYRLDEGMEKLHTACYREILAGNGPGIIEAAPSIELCHKISAMAAG